MLKQRKHALGFGFMLALPLALSVNTANAQEPEKAATVPGMCTATLDLESVPIQPEEVVVGVQFSTAIGNALAATVQRESGVQVVKVEATPGASESAGANVTLNTSSAVAGEWTLAFEGENGTCAGKLLIGEGGSPLH